MKSDFKTHQNRNGPSKNGVKESRLVSVTVFLCQPYSVFKVDHLGSTQSHIFGFMTTKTEKKLKLEIKKHNLQCNAILAGCAAERFSVETIQLFPLPNFTFIV